jgi:hypothetical protein
MRTLSILIGSAMFVAAFGSATMAQEANGCAGHYDAKTGTNFAACPGTTLEFGLQGTGAAGASGATGATGGGSGATGGNR